MAGTAGIGSDDRRCPTAFQICASHAPARRYGRPRVWKDLHEAGKRVSEKRAGRLMREAGLRARVRKGFPLHNDE